MSRQAQSTGNGAVATVSLTTVANEWWGVPAGHDVNVTIVYLSRSKLWEDLLPNETRGHVVPTKDPDDPTKTPTSGPFENFPHYSTGSQLHVTAQQSNLLADLCGWVVHANKDTFVRALNISA